MATVRLAISLTVSDAALDSDSTAPVMVVEKTITGLNNSVVKRRVVNNTTVDMWDPSAAGESVTDFDFLALWVTEGSVEVELTCNNGNAAEAVFTVTVTPDTPLILGSDDSRYNSGALTGSSDVIDLIRVKNGAASNVVVYLVLAT